MCDLLLLGLFTQSWIYGWLGFKNNDLIICLSVSPPPPPFPPPPPPSFFLYKVIGSITFKNNNFGTLY